MLRAQFWRRATTGRLALAIFAVLLMTLVPFAAHSATAGGAITVTHAVTIGDLTGVNEITLAGLTEQDDESAPLVLGVQWKQDNTGWFPTWKLQLTSAAGLIGNNATIMDLGSVHPARDHTYETTLSYSAELGAVAMRIYDMTDDKVVYTDGFEVAAHNGPLFAPQGTTTAAYLPVGTTWSTGVSEVGKAFLPIGQFPSRSDQAGIRIVTPSAAPGEFRFTLEHDGQEQLIASLKAEGQETRYPLSLDPFPLGQSALRLDYIENGEVLLTDSRPVVIGRVDFWMQPVQPNRENGTLEIAINVNGSEPYSEEITAAVQAVVYQLVWNAERRAFEEVLVESNVPLFEGVIDLTSGTTRLPLTYTLPEQPANWKIVVSTDIEPKVGSSLGGQERLFSTHLPAEIAPGDPYRIVVLPDTQYFAQSHPTIFTRMTDWITANAADMGIAAVLHVGDITNNDTPPQWERAYRSMSLLHGVVPYALTLGNHDMTNGSGGQVRQRGLTLINNYFSAEEARRYSNLAGTMVPDRLENHYHLFTIGDTDYLVIALEFGPPNEAVDWANEIAAQYPDHKMILLTHSYTATSGARSRSADGYPYASTGETTVNSGPDMWDKFVRRHANSLMVISGHTSPPLTIPHNVALARTGQPVFELLFDYQNQDNGGNGWLGIMTFSPDNTVDIRVYSPFLDEIANERDSRGYTSHLVLDLKSGLTRRLQD